MLSFAVGFNLWLYKAEPTAVIDPNDNTFQYALVDRTNSIWDFAYKKCSSSLSGILTFPVCHFSYLSDHWVHNWAVGYNLPYYYSHIPQIVIVGTWRFISSFVPHLSLFTYYHIVIYLLLCLIPVPVFLALRVMGLPFLTAGVGALLATHLSTDGLYGLDPSSFLWRGYGLSSQLFAMIWLPLALAYSFRFFTSDEYGENWKQFLSEPVSAIVSLWKKVFGKGHRLASEHADKKEDSLLRASRKNSFPVFLASSVFFVTATTAGHLGIGMICMLSIGFLAVGTPLARLIRQESVRDIIGSSKMHLLKLVLVAGISIFLLSYWILPTFIYGNFHNISFWDPVWKFDSYGAKETIIRLLNGDLYDFGRLPFITILTLLGVVVCLRSPVLSPFSFLFIFWLFFYFGRTTWGGLIDLIPGMKDFHLSRFLVGVHVSGMLLAPIGFAWIAQKLYSWIRTLFPEQFRRIPAYIQPVIRMCVFLIALFILLLPVYKWTLTYNELNIRLIAQANTNYTKAKPEEQALFAKLRSLPPARIFAGRGGGYGKRFRIAETPYYMHLSTFGLPTSLWLPETWSMNSDTEQYFSDNLARDYDLYNLRWIVAPTDEPAQEFWKQIDENPGWKLYEVPTSGYFTVGVRPATVSVTKTNLVNLIHRWIQSDIPSNGLFPELTFDTHYPKTTGIPNFRMTDEVTYITPDGKKHNIWSEPPVYLPPGTASLEAYTALKDKTPAGIRLVGPESVDSNMIFRTKVEVSANCAECLVILKQTAHPNWKAYVDGKPAKTMIVLPFYTAVRLDSPGVHEITLTYEPSLLKEILFVLAAATIIVCFWLTRRSKRHVIKTKFEV